MLARLVTTLFLVFAPLAALAQGFDHMHAAWETLLGKHVKPISNGNAAQVDYKGFMQDRAALQAYLKSVSAVTAGEYNGWSKAQKFAFLANAYNAFTIEKILTRYPNLKSIRDFGTYIGNPWKDRFFTMLGREQNLDGIEHDTLRTPGAFDDPRVHVAVNCASIGCPMLGLHALTADKLDAQLDELFGHFMSDRSRNRYNPKTRTVEISRIFDWYGKDFEKGFKGFASVADVAAKYADQLADTPEDRAVLREKKAAISFLEYDWTLNDVK
jgi:hypothetical protein